MFLYAGRNPGNKIEFFALEHTHKTVLETFSETVQLSNVIKLSSKSL